jgi:beta-lactamase regulating signal transducer with metallopeptidase domain
LNWLWQGVVVAGAAAVMLRVLDRSRAGVRCLICWIALVMVVSLPLVPAALAMLSSAAPAVVAAPVITVPNAWWTSGTLAVALWALWAGIYALRIAGALVVVRRARNASQPFPGKVAESLPNWQRVYETGRRAPLVVSDRVRTAAVLGGGAPVIAVTPALVGRLDSNELDRVILHEWAHVQRRDDLTRIGQLAARAVAGWHPAVWWLDRRLVIEQELACDEMVVAVSGGAKSYASCLVKLAAARPAQRDVLLAAGALSSAGIARRVTRLVSRKRFASSAWSRRAAGIGVLTLLVVAFGIAPVRIVEAAVSATVGRVLQPIARVAPANSAGITRRAEPARRERSQSAPPSLDVSPASDEIGGAAIESDAAVPDVPADAAAGLDAADSREPESLPSLDSPATPPVTSPPASLVTSPLPVDDGLRSVWSPAADAGAAVGRGSRKAGVATAGAFTRFAKRIADSF